jgi:hypothetical protein
VVDGDETDYPPLIAPLLLPGLRPGEKNRSAPDSLSITDGRSPSSEIRYAFQAIDSPS